ncbi:hypothetical protein GCM10027517_19320 [Phycicoccus ginsengisoli]
MAEDPEGLEGIQGAVDRGRRERRPAVGGDERDDPVGRHVPLPRDDVEHPATLGRHPQAPGAQLLSDVLHPPTLRSWHEPAPGLPTLGGC